jgi:hypothetical protein
MAGQPGDLLPVAAGDHPLEVPPQLDYMIGPADLDHRALGRRQAAVAHHHEDDVIDRIRLDSARVAPVALAEDPAEPLRDHRKRVLVIGKFHVRFLFR